MLGQIIKAKKKSDQLKRKRMKEHVKSSRGKNMILPRTQQPKPGRDLGNLLTGLMENITN